MIPHRNIFKDIGRIFFWFPLRWCTRIVPFSIIYWVGGVLGNVDYILSGRKRTKRMVKNISLVFRNDEKEASRIIRKNLQNHCRTVLEFMKYPQINTANLAKVVSFEGLEFLDAELNKGNGVILSTAHFGAKQSLQIALGHKGYPINQIYYHMSRDELSFVQKNVSQKQRKKIEEKIPCTFISAKGFLRSAYRCIKNNEILIIAADGIGLKDYMDKSFFPFEFLGKKMLFPTGAASMAKKTGAGMIPVFVVREKTKHRIVFESPINISGETNIDAVKHYVRVLEKYVRQYPALWEFWEEFEKGYLLEDSC